MAMRETQEIKVHNDWKWAAFMKLKSTMIGNEQLSFYGKHVSANVNGWCFTGISDLLQYMHVLVC